jgi:hypothetical protein
MNRSSKPLPKDPNQWAVELIRRSTEETEPPALPGKAVMSANFATLGRAGGLKGDRNRAKALSSRKRKQIAKKAAKARWGN